MAFVFHNGNALGLGAWRLVYPIKASHRSHRAAFDFLNSCDYLNKDKFLLDFLGIVGQEKAQNFYLDELYNLYRRADFNDLQSGFDYLLPYLPADKDAVIKVVEIIREREKQERTPFNWHGLIGAFSETTKVLGEVFAHRVDLIKSIYLDNLVNQDTDYHSKSFIQILDLDPKFVFEYVDWMYAHHEFLSRNNDHRNYNFLWERDDYKELMLDIIDYVFEKGENRFLDSYLEVFFVRHEGEVIESLEQRKLGVLKSYIQKNCHEQDSMICIFQLIADVFSHQHKELLATFLECNQNFTDFKVLPFMPSMQMFHGSHIPVHEEEIKRLESLLPLFAGNLNLLQHRSNVEAQIEGLRRTIEYEVRREFIGR